MLYKCLLIVVVSSLTVYGQDTINYNGFVILDKTSRKTELLYYQSLTLHPDGTCVWRSEYDLAFEEYGTYFIKNDILTLNLYSELEKPGSFPDLTLKPWRILHYKMASDQLYILNDKGKVINRIKDRSLKSWPWRLQYIFRKEKRSI